jgi:hypothetical protein
MEFVYNYEECNLEEIINKYDKLSQNDEEESMKSESKNDFEVDISSTIRNNSTLQVAHYEWPAFTLRQNKKQNKMLKANHYIVVKCSKQSWFNADAMGYEKQDYALVITISHENVDTIYSEVKNIISVQEHLRNLN